MNGVATGAPFLGAPPFWPAGIFLWFIIPPLPNPPTRGEGTLGSLLTEKGVHAVMTEAGNVKLAAREGTALAGIPLAGIQRQGADTRKGCPYKMLEGL